MLRLATPADVPEILEIYTPYVTDTTVSFEYIPPTLEAFRLRFETITARFPWLVWEEGGRILGYAYASLPFERAAYAWCAEPSIYLRPEARGRGIGGKLYAALESLLEKQGYRLLLAIITGENTASLRFHEKQGYEHLAVFPNCGCKFGRWISVNWMGKRLQSSEMPIAPPIPWAAIVESDEFNAFFLDVLSLSPS